MNGDDVSLTNACNWPRNCCTNRSADISDFEDGLQKDVSQPL